MEFNETGLPKDNKVFAAFRKYKQVMQSLGDFSEIEGADMPVRAAQVIHQNAPGRNDMIIMALLSHVPVSALGGLEKSFGEDTVQRLVEADKHNMTGFAHVTRAHDDVKLLALAFGVATFRQLEDASVEFEERLLQQNMGSSPAPTTDLTLPILPGTRGYDYLARVLYNTTSAPALEEAFIDGLEQAKLNNNSNMEKIRSLGVSVVMPGADPMTGEMLEDDPRPEFEATAIYDHPKVRAVYDHIVEDPRVSQADFDTAVGVARYLSEHSANPNPTTIAAGLMDVALRERMPQDYDFFKGLVDDDVTAIVKKNSVYRIETSAEVAQASLAFRQIALANATYLMESAKLDLEDLMDVAKDSPEQFLPMVRMLYPQIANVARSWNSAVHPTLGKNDMPELETVYKENITNLGAALKETHTWLLENQPKKPPSSPSGPNFNGPQ